jgi:hypothetical protein
MAHGIDATTFCLLYETGMYLALTPSMSILATIRITSCTGLHPVWPGCCRLFCIQCMREGPYSAFKCWSDPSNRNKQRVRLTRRRRKRIKYELYRKDTTIASTGRIRQYVTVNIVTERNNFERVDPTWNASL